MTLKWPIVVFYKMIDISALNATFLYLLFNVDPVGQRQGNRLPRMLLIKLGKKLARVEDTEQHQLMLSKSNQSSEPVRKKVKCMINDLATLTAAKLINLSFIQ